MKMRRWLIVTALVAGAAACGGNDADYPKLLPMDQLMRPPAIPGHAADAIDNPDAVTTNLEGRAAGLRHGPARPAGASDAELQARARALRERARALSTQSVDDGAATCTAGAPDCPETPAN